VQLDEFQLAAQRTQTLPVDAQQFAYCQRVFHHAAALRMTVRNPAATVFVIDDTAIQAPDSPDMRGMFAIAEVRRDLNLSDREFKSLLFRTYRFRRLVYRPEVVDFVKPHAAGGMMPAAGLTFAGARAKMSFDRDGKLDFDIPDVLATAAAFRQAYGDGDGTG
jgi:hypothetical protein